MENLTKWLNDDRLRSAAAGAGGGLAGWLVAEVLVGAPQSFLGTLGFGLLAGLGIGALLGVAEGAVKQSLAMMRRGALIGLGIGAAGGMVGAAVGQIGFLATSNPAAADESVPGRSVFSADLRERLREAGAKEGEIEIGLIWENRNDLDLHVVDPAQQRISYRSRRSASGGELDVDRNAGCQQDVTDKPVEHVVWPNGSAPFGSYAIHVHHFQNCGPGDPTPFRVELIVDGKQSSFSGTVSANEAPQLVNRFTRSEAEPELVSTFSVAGLIARILGWTMFGALVGCSEGLRRRSLLGTRNAALGGAIGGAIGGLMFEVIAQATVPLHLGDTLPRLIGLVILGACVGVFVVLVQRALSAAFSVRSGRYEGSQIVLDKAVMRMGRNDSLEVFLGGDPEIAAHHATVRSEGASHWLVREGGAVTVNGNDVARHELRDGDTVMLGKTRLGYKRGVTSSTSKAHVPTATATAAAAPASGRKVGPPPPPPSKKNK